MDLIEFPHLDCFVTLHRLRGEVPGSGDRWMVALVHSDGTWSARTGLLAGLPQAEEQACRIAEEGGWALHSEAIDAGTWSESPDDDLDDLDELGDDGAVDEWAAPEAPPHDPWCDPAEVLRRALELAGPAAVARAAIDHLAGDDRRPS